MDPKIGEVEPFMEDDASLSMEDDADPPTSLPPVGITAIVLAIVALLVTVGVSILCARRRRKRIEARALESRGTNSSFTSRVPKGSTRAVKSSHLMDNPSFGEPFTTSHFSLQITTGPTDSMLSSSSPGYSMDTMDPEPPCPRNSDPSTVRYPREVPTAVSTLHPAGVHRSSTRGSFHSCITVNSLPPHSCLHHPATNP
ncbi:MAG: hypothetical protein DHS80DRAFT_21461 [Piptocephalis tieghemiana]|nr:MAG: hypothetical protein DHS80DRAFT_21461 [Piptocephalis tieghemiana]